MGPMWLLMTLLITNKIRFCFKFETIIPWSQCFWQERKNILRHNFFWRQNHSQLTQNRRINMIMIYYWDKKLKKRLHVLQVDYNI